MTQMPFNEVKNALSASACAVEEFLDCVLTDGGDAALAPIFDAMRYSALAGGKRVRPFLVLAFCELFGGDRQAALPLAAAVEMIHTYSLIHDDLPCMDDDDLRRGRPTNHKVYGEATAVLAGDALLTFAFETVASAPCLTHAQIARAVRVLAKAAGPCGMVGGQIMDMAAESEKPSLATLDRLQERKTGALIRVAAELGCIAAFATAEETENALCYADGIGRAFQITDDILDVYGDTATLGKTVGSDAEEGKTTYMTYMSREDAEEKATSLTETAKNAISGYGGAGLLLAFADMMLKREN